MKTLIEIPDTLFQEANRIAEENGITLEDLVRLGLEEMVRRRALTKAGKTWTMPPSFNLGETLAREEEWTQLSHV